MNCWIVDVKKGYRPSFIEAEQPDLANKMYEIQLWDTNGEEKFKSITKLFLKNSKKVTLLPNDELYVYTVEDDSESFIHIHDLNKFYYFLNGFSKGFKIFS